MTDAELAEGQMQWKVEEATQYTHTIDAQLYNDRPILGLLGDISKKDVIDIGCGNGYLTRKLRDAKRVVGVDFSPEMIQQATELKGDVANLKFQVASGDDLPFPAERFNAAVCSLTINNYPTVAMTQKSFAEASRVLKSGGRYVISLPHPLTLHEATQYRKTEWEPGQRQDNLVPGERFKRKIMGKDGKMIEIVNYYWPSDVLINFASRYSLEHTQTIELLATKDELRQYPEQLEPIREKVPFFLVMSFSKRR